MNRIDHERRTVEMMIRLYCRHKEGNETLCDNCRELMEYARTRRSDALCGPKDDALSSLGRYCAHVSRMDQQEAYKTSETTLTR